MVQKNVSRSSASRRVIEDRLEALAEAEELAKGSRLSEEDVEVLTRKVNAATRRHAKKLWKANKN